MEQDDNDIARQLLEAASLMTVLLVGDLLVHSARPSEADDDVLPRPSEGQSEPSPPTSGHRT